MFINKIYSKGPKKNYATKKPDVYQIDVIWSLDILDIKDYCSENNRLYRYVLVIIDNFSKLGWAVPIKNKKAQTIEDSFENVLISSKRKPNSIETDRGKEFHNKIFQDFLYKNKKNFILETAHMAPFLQIALIVLLEIFLNDLFLKKVTVIGLKYYLK